MLSGHITSPPMLSGHITSPPMLSGHITSPPMLSGHITSPPMLLGHITSPPMLLGHITSPPMLLGHITSPPMLSGHITSPPMLSGHITSPPMLLGHITSPPMLLGHITSPPMLSGHITSPPMLLGHITSPPMLSGHINPHVAHTSPPMLLGHITSPPMLSGHITSPPMLLGHITSPPMLLGHITSPPMLLGHITSPPMPSLFPRTSTGRSEGGAGLGRDSQSQESREISAMQQQLNKTSTRVSVNERSRHGNEKGAIKKQPQVLWQGNSGGGVSRGSGAGEDPRQAQVLVLQEELRQKKNALEALTRRMGKSSSLNMDNISDNLSDNVSETSDNLGDARGSSGAATWGEAGGLHHFSDNHYQQSSDEDLIEEDEADLPPRSQCRPQHPPPPTVSPKDRNRHSGSHHRRRQDSGRLSINNLSTALPTPSRTKHNRLRSGSAPKALWESVGTPDGANYKSPSNTTMQTQHSLNTALNQVGAAHGLQALTPHVLASKLNQVQGTINTLQECLRQEQSQVLGGARPSHYQPQLVAPLLPDLTPTSLPPGVPPSQALTPMSAYAGLGSLALAAQGGGETMNQQLLAGMQQCFSQLHLHSLEIQALSKHLQLYQGRNSCWSVKGREEAQLTLCAILLDVVRDISVQ
ncbi:LWamide neuropeptide [Chionoecetes opilio]|uniref:LWamide neuropeptide n=1 Tax=Chionoecetes opilio TaxID=41210 RepID=A0A8J4YSA7_CHIOP|nr:LWamide neuropeptide [Chionoecetes opilio]